MTDDERREAAERLRDEVGCGSSWPGMERLGLILGIKREPRTGWEGRILTRLADLIDPSDTSQGCRDIVACDLIEPSESVKCIAEVKVDGEKLVHDAVVEYAGVDREALLALAQSMMVRHSWLSASDAARAKRIADRIREACGEVVE